MAGPPSSDLCMEFDHGHRGVGLIGRLRGLSRRFNLVQLPTGFFGVELRRNFVQLLRTDPVERRLRTEDDECQHGHQCKDSKGDLLQELHEGNRSSEELQPQGNDATRQRSSQRYRMVGLKSRNAVSRRRRQQRRPFTAATIRRDVRIVDRRSSNINRSCRIFRGEPLEVSPFPTDGPSRPTAEIRRDERDNDRFPHLRGIRTGRLRDARSNRELEHRFRHQ